MFVTTTVVTVVGSCYIAKDYDRFKYSINSVLSSRIKIAINETKVIINEKIVKLFWGYGKLLLITFGELLIGLFMLKVPNALLLSVIIALLDLLPVFGTGTILVPWAIFSIISGKYYLGVGLIILYVIILIVRNALEPRMIGRQIGLHPLIALICVFIGLKLFGIIGMILLPLSVMLIYNMFEKGIFKILFSDK
jgi:sporulation integral membrane protein YtvI